MDFQQAFIESLLTNIRLTKTISLTDYLPSSVNTPKDITENLPYVQAYGDIKSQFPYYYESSHLKSFCCIYTDGGSGTLTCNNQKYVLIPNSFAIINCNEKHRIEIKQSPWNFKNIFIYGNPLPFIFKTLTNHPVYLHNIPLGSSLPTMMNHFILQLNKNSNKYFLQAKTIIDLFTGIIVEKEEAIESNNKIPKYLLLMKNNFDMNYSMDFSLNTLEQEYHISKYRICHEFKEQFQLSPMQYLYNKRIEIAKEALIYTDKRINEIGRMVGFENTNHFIRLFKKQIGITPLLYRKQSPIL